jgi:hypothetical protein
VAVAVAEAEAEVALGVEAVVEAAAEEGSDCAVVAGDISLWHRVA